MLFVEFHGSEEGVAEQSRRFSEIAREYGGSDFAWTTNPEERTKLWQARHDVYWACLTLRPGARPFATDVCVPISRLAECVAETQADIAAQGLIAPIVGHVGDGNFHVSPLIDVENPDEVQRAEAFSSRLAKRAIAMEGTCTGEHGVGQKKIPYLEIEHGEATLDLMRHVKLALDPQNLFNPGKIFGSEARSPLIRRFAPPSPAGGRRARPLSRLRERVGLRAATLVIHKREIRFVARAAHARFAVALPPQRRINLRKQRIALRRQIDLGDVEPVRHPDRLRVNFAAAADR